MFLAKNILLPVKGERWEEQTFGIASILSKLSRGTIHALHIIEIERSLPVDAEIDVKTNHGEETLAWIESLAREADCSLTSDLLQSRRAGPAIVQESIEKSIDAIVLGTNDKPNHRETVLGNTVDYILRESQCHVLLLRNQLLAPLHTKD